MEKILDKYAKFLPVNENTPLITLGEGFTPLIKTKHLGKMMGIDLYLKYEGMNPTGSFKDRGMVVAIAKSIEKGAKTVICASTGNTSASAAAYATAFDLKAIVVIPSGKIAIGKLAQSLIYGAKVVQINGNFDDCLKMVRLASEKFPVTVVNSINPYRLQGQKTAAFEIIDELGEAPDYHFLPVGNAGNITAYWMGYKEYRSYEKSSKLPRMMGFQAEGAAPIVKGYPIENPETIATAIRIGNPASWQKAIVARDESKGVISTVTDKEILEAQQLIAMNEGIFCEPASAASVAGILKMKDIFKGGETVVATLTGNGLKDPNVVDHEYADRIKTIPANFDAFSKEVSS
ncbi:MAG: threonine synthase [Thermotogae bacterium]|nr:threonine synthase [Thermotogota bacterium]MCL5031713.1 threonine synthase [Thermotogota bacterium]